MKISIVKNPNCPEATKHGRGFELGSTKKQSQVVVRAGLEPGTAGLRVRHADPSATLSRKKERICLKLSIPLVFLKVSVTCLFVYIFVNLYSNCFFLLLFFTIWLFFSVFTESWSGSYSPSDVYHCVFVVST